MNRYKAGKKPARPGAIRHKFSSLFDASALPVPPQVFGRTSYFPEDGWGMLANDQVGDCVIAGGMHEMMLLSALGGRGAPTFNDAGALAEYSAITGYVPGDDDTDNGTDMVDAAHYRQRTGLVDADGVRHKIDGFVSLPPGDIDQIALGAYLFGVVGLGVNLTSQCEDQFDAEEPWAMTSKPGNEGGHYVPCVGRNHEGNLLIVTWGRLHAVEPAWLAERMDEGVAYISRESLRGNELLNQRNLDWPAIERAMGHFG